MNKDAVVEEVRKIREAHAAKFAYQLHAICADLKEKEKKLRSSACIFSAETPQRSGMYFVADTEPLLK